MIITHIILIMEGIILTTIGIALIIHIIHIIIKRSLKMYYRYQPYPYYRRYYNINPYYYGRYYNPYYNYQQNIVDSQIANVDQSIDNFGVMTDVIQDSDVYQSMTPEHESQSEHNPEHKSVGICTVPAEPVPFSPI